MLAFFGCCVCVCFFSSTYVSVSGVGESVGVFISLCASLSLYVSVLCASFSVIVSCVGKCIFVRCAYFFPRFYLGFRFCVYVFECM